MAVKLTGQKISQLKFNPAVICLQNSGIFYLIISYLLPPFTKRQQWAITWSSWSNHSHRYKQFRRSSWILMRSSS